jgi:hypothetical protein
LRIERVDPHEAFSVMVDFVETLNDSDMQDRLSDALNGRKPFAHFNRLVHTTTIREQWLNFTDRTYTEKLKE